jgi:hypothetical protein
MSEVSRAILFALATRRSIACADLADATGHSAREVQASLAELERSEMVAARSVDSPRIGLTPAGEKRALSVVEAERVALVPELSRLYLEFTPLNREVKAAVSGWQMSRPPDPGLLAALGRAHRRALPLLDRLSELRRRYASLHTRLAAAMARIEGGETRYVAGVAVDSFHSLWWQLHADLLAVLGRERGEADA